MHQSVSAQHTFLWVACISFHGLHPCKAALWSQSDVGQKGKVVNIPPAPLHHHQQFSVDISPLGSRGRGHWNSVLLVTGLPNISVSYLGNNPAPSFGWLLWVVTDLVITLLAYKCFHILFAFMCPSGCLWYTKAKQAVFVQEIIILGSVLCYCPLRAVLSLAGTLNAIVYVAFSPHFNNGAVFALILILT